MDDSSHKEFRVSNDGGYVAVGDEDGEVSVICIADGRRYDLAEATYQYGGCRLAVDGKTGTLFSGAYHNTGIAAYELETGDKIWHRQDLKKVQKIAYDARDDVLYCQFEGRASRPLKARDGRERKPIRGLEDFYLSNDGRIAVFQIGDVKLENRAAGISHIVDRESEWAIDAAFSDEAVILSWGGGPVVSYSIESGNVLWRYATEGTHAFDIALASNRSSIWVAEQPYREPPWSRLRLISNTGNVEQEIRCNLGHSFEILPNCDRVVRADLEITPIEELMK